MYKSLIVLVTMFVMLIVPVSASPMNPENIRFVVIDSSKETYGSELKNEITSKLDKQMPGCQIARNDLGRNTLDQLQRGDRQDLNSLAKDMGTNDLLTVEILPVKVDYREMLFYKKFRTDATLRLRLYNAATQQYTLVEDVAGHGSNTTIIPYTSVSTKPAVEEAIKKATDAGIQKINQSLADLSN
jgi:hypothetical protein